ncbi:MAG: Acyl-CoA synthetase (AMP-forming)/AMP-acid ligase [Lacunisphaera sp.]|nr:Acyl-CoA synthetase (AMP-forming)/AMP-acid ligase [Lacunisphaera sp.]
MSHALLQAWANTVRRHGAARAVVQARDRAAVTFHELDARAAAWRETHAPDQGKFAGRAVVFAAPNGIGWLEIFLGLLKAGAVVVPLDAAEPPAAQRNLAQSLRAGFWWNGHQLEPLAGAKRFRDPAVCLIKLTSGTTGKPRALVFTAEQLLADGRQVTLTMGISRRDLNYALIPLGHSYGLGNLTIPLLAQGVPLVCGTAPLPHAIAEDFARWRPTVFPGVPAMWRALAGSDLALPGLRRGISAGAPLPPEVAREFAARLGQRLHSFYGSSETGGIAYDATGRAALAGQVGRAMRGVKLRARRGARLEVSSAAVTTHGNRRRRGKFGAWLMPDRVAVDARGNLTLLGRRGTTVKIAGRRVNLAEVTDRLRRLPGVREAWAGVSAGSDPVLGAVVASDRTAAELRSALQADTAAWKIPKRLAVVAALPVTARGKPDARALRALTFPSGRAPHAE